ncbi:hypothetical protein GIB67_011498 [Kingdonia uniflora]|uniref:Uncharacterized protein n=1 Tax=Kingdonia uniflora TaxID=39325 RepID=A0A7J7NLY4_9MAGN|nr:hypothetical protein GIB67_011498 [Kingdonia uniflora]
MILELRINRLTIRVLNLAIVIPLMVVSLEAGPWDALFGRGNIPAFVLASKFSLLGGVIAIIRLPKLMGTSYKSIDTGNRACFFFIHLALWPHYRPCGRFILALVFGVINVIQSPDQRNSVNAILCLWMADGNILGFSAGSNGNWHSIIATHSDGSVYKAQFRGGLVAAVKEVKIINEAKDAFNKEVQLLMRLHYQLL